jgi:hypothetical protein
MLTNYNSGMASGETRTVEQQLAKRQCHSATCVSLMKASAAIMDMFPRMCCTLALRVVTQHQVVRIGKLEMRWNFRTALRPLATDWLQVCSGMYLEKLMGSESRVDIEQRVHMVVALWKF